MKENKQLEYKVKITNTFLKTVSAFANFGDGEIIFGIDDSGNVCGIDDTTRACLDIENKINDSIAPKPNFELIVNKDNTIQLKVYKGSYAPYLYKGKAYRRSDTATVEVDQMELRKLVLEASNLYFEELSCQKEDLTFHTLRSQMMKILEITDLSNDILRTLGLLTKQKEYNNAASILSDTNDFYGVDIARFGKSINEIMDRKIVQHESIFNQQDIAIEFYQRYYQYDEISGIERKTIELIPEKAFREAVANALVHRDWSFPSHVRIAMYSDRVEIYSPGGLPNGITKEEYLKGEISCFRNPILANVFFRLHYIEMFASGIKRILDVYKNYDRKPQFDITDHSICVILPVVTSNFEVTLDESKIIECLKNGKQLSCSELCKQTGFNKAKVVRQVNSLIEKKYVSRIGNGRATKYRL